MVLHDEERAVVVGQGVEERNKNNGLEAEEKKNKWTTMTED